MVSFIPPRFQWAFRIFVSFIEFYERRSLNDVHVEIIICSFYNVK